MATTLSVLQLPVRERPVAGRITAAVARFRIWISQTLCAINGHERYRHLTADCVCLRCLLCGHETTGWALSPSGHVHRAMPQVRVHHVQPPVLTAVRRGQRMQRTG